MNQMMNSVMSAVIGGVVGASVMLFTGGIGGQKIDLENLEATNLKVASLTITDQAALVNTAGNPVVLLREGSILVDNVIFAKKLVGQQVQGHAVVANRVFTTPDDLIATPIDQWRFFTEIGSSLESGGEIVIRSDKGFAAANRQITNGALLRVGFDTEANPEIFGLQNVTRSIMPINNDLSATQRQALSNQGAVPNANVMNNSGMMSPQNFSSDTATPLQGQIYQTPVATQQQEGNAIR